MGIDAEEEIEIEENEEIEEEEEEEEEVEEDGVYTLRFEDGMNPLDFTENDASGLQPYEQFERLEYEALAEKKRKALSQCQLWVPFFKFLSCCRRQVGSV